MISAISNVSAPPEVQAPASQPAAVTASATLKPDTVSLSPQGLHAAAAGDADGDGS